MAAGLVAVHASKAQAARAESRDMVVDDGRWKAATMPMLRDAAMTQLSPRL
jgi:hypothetical protein